MKQELPACPVEITMGLIGDKWKVLILRDLLTRNKKIWRIKEIFKHYYSEGINKQFKTNGIFWSY